MGVFFDAISQCATGKYLLKIVLSGMDIASADSVAALNSPQESSSLSVALPRGELGLEDSHNRRHSGGVNFCRRNGTGALAVDSGSPLSVSHGGELVSCLRWRSCCRLSREEGDTNDLDQRFSRPFALLPSPLGPESASRRQPGLLSAGRHNSDDKIWSRPRGGTAPKS